MTRSILVSVEKPRDLPHVARVSYEHIPYSSVSLEHNRLARRIYKSITNTWGFSGIQHEISTDILITKSCSYFCFKEEEDCLFFTLSTGANKVHMWPGNLRFTIHTYTCDNM